MNIEIEKKYLIQKPSLNYLYSISDVTVVNITQIYLYSMNGEERRIRKISHLHNDCYYYTTKKRISNISREEDEIIIDLSEFERLKKESDPNYSIIKKKANIVSL